MLDQPAELARLVISTVEVRRPGRAYASQHQRVACPMVAPLTLTCGTACCVPGPQCRRSA